MKQLQKIFLLIILFAPFHSVLADETCDKVDATTSKYFKQTLSAAKELSTAYCKRESPVKIKELREKFKKNVYEETQKLTEAGIKILPELETFFTKTVTDEPQQWTDFFVERKRTPMGKVTYYFSFGKEPENRVTFGREENGVCEQPNSYRAPCFEVLRDLQPAITAYKSGAVRRTTDEVGKQAKEYTAEWEKYLTESRSMTTLELLANTLIFRNDLNDDRPPKWQFILLHPNIVFENVGEAPEGSELKEAFSLEYAGVNFWNWKIPLGVSVMSTYADRENVESFRTGLVFHINNSYSLGVSRGSDNTYGVSVSMDFIKLFTSKEKTYDSFRKGFEKN